MLAKTKSDFQRAVALLLLLAVIISGGAFYVADMTYEHDQKVRTGEIHAANNSTARIVEENIRLMLSQADNILWLMKADMEKYGFIESEHIPLLDNLLKLPTINQVAVADKEGNLTYSAVPLQAPLNISMREHFRAQIPGDTGRLYIAAPWINRATGTPSIFLSRRVNDSQGNFAGIVAVGLKQDYLEKMFSDLELGEGQSIVLLRRDGAFLSRVPDAVSFAKLTDAYRSHIAFDFIAQGQMAGTYESASKSEGRSILGAFRTMADHPLVVLTGFDKASVLESTAQRRLMYLLWAGVLSALLVAAFAIIWRLMRRQYLSAAALYEERSLLRATLGSMREGVIVTDETARVRLINKSAEDIIGWTQAEADGRDVGIILPLTDAATGESTAVAVGTVLTTGEIFGLPDGIVLHTPQGQERHLAGSLAPISGVGGTTTGVVINFHDLTEKIQIERLSYRDSLTGVYNRRFFEAELKRAAQPDHLPLSLIVADIDGLKEVNDTLGHLAGDQLIVQTVHAIQAALRQADVVARAGGDEFAVILRNTSEAAAKTIVRRMAEKCAETIVDGRPLSCSFGCAEMRSADQDINTILAEADRRMYEEKRSAKSRL